jgi:hypothetical protein
MQAIVDEWATSLFRVMMWSILALHASVSFLLLRGRTVYDEHLMNTSWWIWQSDRPFKMFAIAIVSQTPLDKVKYILSRKWIRPYSLPIKHTL